MDDTERASRLLKALEEALNQAAVLVERGEEAFNTDPAIPLAHEALSNRIGNLAKRLIQADPQRFSAPEWRLAARNRDFVVHHYDRVDPHLLWQTVSVSFPTLLEVVRISR